MEETIKILLQTISQVGYVGLYAYLGYLAFSLLKVAVIVGGPCYVFLEIVKIMFKDSKGE